MLDKAIVKLLNEQLNREFYSAYLYLAMANYYDSASLSGFENWFSIQEQEERAHAMLFRAYLMLNDEPVELAAIDAPNVNYDSYDAPLAAALEHERFISKSINDIYAEAYTHKDFRTMQFLDWFVKEQVEEEKNVNDLLSKYKLFAGDGKGLYLLDQELQARVFNPPSLVL